MHRTEVDSGHLHAVGYDPITKTMEIEFKNGYVYRGNVPQEHHAAMMASDSVGSYYHQNIKNLFDMERVK